MNILICSYPSCDVPVSSEDDDEAVAIASFDVYQWTPSTVEGKEGEDELIGSYCSREHMVLDQSGSLTEAWRETVPRGA